MVTILLYLWCAGCWGVLAVKLQVLRDDEEYIDINKERMAFIINFVGLPVCICIAVLNFNNFAKRVRS